MAGMEADGGNDMIVRINSDLPVAELQEFLLRSVLPLTELPVIERICGGLDQVKEYTDLSAADLPCRVEVTAPCPECGGTGLATTGNPVDGPDYCICLQFSDSGRPIESIAGRVSVFTADTTAIARVVDEIPEAYWCDEHLIEQGTPARLYPPWDGALEYDDGTDLPSWPADATHGLVLDNMEAT